MKSQDVSDDTERAPIEYFVADPCEIHAEFAQVIGPAEVLKAYGPTWPRTYRIQREDTVEFRWAGKRCAWTSLFFDAHENQVVMSSGVYPEYRRRGLQRFMSRWAENLVSDPLRYLHKPTHLVVKILHTNTEWLTFHKQLIEQGSTSWVLAGDVWLPEPGYMLFAKPLAQSLARLRR
jgi:GNAT superfamily N-acetyltransferase